MKLFFYFKISFAASAELFSNALFERKTSSLRRMDWMDFSPSSNFSTSKHFLLLSSWRKLNLKRKLRRDVFSIINVNKTCEILNLSFGTLASLFKAFEEWKQRTFFTSFQQEIKNNFLKREKHVKRKRTMKSSHQLLLSSRNGSRSQLSMKLVSLATAPALFFAMIYNRRHNFNDDVTFMMAIN